MNRDPLWCFASWQRFEPSSFKKGYRSRFLRFTKYSVRGDHNLHHFGIMTLLPTCVQINMHVKKKWKDLNGRMFVRLGPKVLYLTLLHIGSLLWLESATVVVQAFTLAEDLNTLLTCWTCWLVRWRLWPVHRPSQLKELPWAFSVKGTTELSQNMFCPTGKRDQI